MMLKKSLLALSLAAAVGSVHAAVPSKITAGGQGTGATDKVGAQTISQQSAVSTIALKDVTFTLTDVASVVANYATLAKVVVTFDGATLSASSDAKLAASNAGVTVGKVAYPNATTIEFPITTAAANALDTMTLSDVVLSVDGSSNVVMTIKAISSVAGVEIDSASGVIAAYVDEYSAKVSTGIGFASQIDVASARKLFTDKTSTDSATVTVTDLTTDHGDTSASLGAGDVVVTLNGDFSFLDLNADGKVDAKDVGSSITGTLAKDLQSTVVKAAAAGDQVFTVATGGKVTLPAQSYTADVAVAYTNSLGAVGSDTTSGLNAGKWTLNGDQTDIAFMPL